MAVTIRRADGRDLELVVSSRVEFLGAAREAGFEPSPELVEKTRVFIETEHSAGRLHTWFAEDGPEVVGIVSILLWPRPPQPEDHRTTEAYIINMYVPPNRQRQGIGRRLLKSCLSSADEFGIRKFLLHATADGRSLYHSAGFAPKTNWMELTIPV